MADSDGRFGLLLVVDEDSSELIVGSLIVDNARNGGLGRGRGGGTTVSATDDDNGDDNDGWSELIRTDLLLQPLTLVDTVDDRGSSRFLRCRLHKSFESVVTSRSLWDRNIFSCVTRQIPRSRIGEGNVVTVTSSN